MTRKELLEIALENSVELQSHYAELLNLFDGGKRMTFKSGKEWIKRLVNIGRLQPIDSADRCYACGGKLGERAVCHDCFSKVEDK